MGGKWTSWNIDLAPMARTEIARSRDTAGRVRSVILSRKHEDRNIKVSGRNSGRTTMWSPREEGREVKSGKRSNRGWCSGEESPSGSRSTRDLYPVTFASYGFKGHVVATSSIFWKPTTWKRKRERPSEREKGGRGRKRENLPPREKINFWSWRSFWHRKILDSSVCEGEPVIPFK